MKTYVGDKYGRRVVIHLDRGELILESIQSEAKRLNIQTGIVTSGIGSACKIVYHRIGSISDSPVNEYITVEGPIEIGSIQGIIIDGQPQLHIVCCDKDNAFSMRLEPGSQLQCLAEISVVKLLDADYVRRQNELGISYIGLC